MPTADHSAYMKMLKLARIVEKMKESLGIDRAISYVLSSRAVSLVVSPVTLLILVSTLNEVEQGFYYAFASLTGISILMELGLGVVLTQFASHEFSKLEWTRSGGITGDKSSINRLAALLRKAILWYGVMSVLLAIVLIPLGIVMFSRKP